MSASSKRHRARPHSVPDLPLTDYMSCPCGKRGYRAKVHARRVRAWMRSQVETPHPTKRLDIYRCDVSDLFHIGHGHRIGLPNQNDSRLRWLA